MEKIVITKTKQKGFTLVGLMIALLCIVGIGYLIVHNLGIAQNYYQASYAVAEMKIFASKKEINPNETPIDKENYIASYQLFKDKSVVFTLGGNVGKDLQGLEMTLNPVYDKNQKVKSWSCAVTKATNKIKNIANCDSE